jgi:hypothetical protein
MATHTITTGIASATDLPCGRACHPDTWPEGTFVCSAHNTALDGLCTRWWGHDGDHIECTVDGHAVHVWPRTALRWVANPTPEPAAAPGGSGEPPVSPASAGRAPGAPIALMTCCGGYPGEHFAGCRNDVA